MKNRLFIIFAIALVLGILGIGFVVYVKSLPPRPDQQLEIGMSESEIHEIFGSPPDFWCRYRTYRICYYEGHGRFSSSFDDVVLEQGATVESLEELPDIYDAVQLAIDANGRLYAHTVIGEVYEVRTARGNVKGSTFAKLDDSNF